MTPQRDSSAPETPVREFHEAFGLDAPTYPTRPATDLVRLRMRLIREEFDEVMYELGVMANQPNSTWDELNDRMRLLLKELSDLRYVVEGTAVAFGLDIEGAYAEVHRSNMSKLGEDGRPIYREDGKVLKGPNYTPANMHLFVPDIVEGGTE